MNIANMYGMVDRAEAELIGLSITNSRFESATREPHRERIDMVVAPRRFAYFAHRGPTKLSTPDNDRIF